MRPVRQVRERGGQPDLQPALAGVPADCFVPQRLVLLPVGGQEQPGRFPLRPPPVLVQPGGGEVRALAQQRPAAPHHRDRPRRQPPVRPGQPGLQRPQADGLSVPLGRGGVPAGPPGLPARRDRQPGLDPADAGLQAGLPGAQVLPGEPVLVLAGAGDRPGPPGGGLRGQCPLAHRAGGGLPLRVQPPLSAPGGQVTPGQRPQVGAGRRKHLSILRGHPQPGPHPRPGRSRRHERGRDRAQPAHPAPPHGVLPAASTARVPMSRCAHPAAFSARLRAAGRRTGGRRTTSAPGHVPDQAAGYPAAIKHDQAAVMRRQRGFRQSGVHPAQPAAVPGHHHGHARAGQQPAPLGPGTVHPGPAPIPAPAPAPGPGRPAGPRRAPRQAGDLPARPAFWSWQDTRAYRPAPPRAGESAAVSGDTRISRPAFRAGTGQPTLPVPAARGPHADALGVRPLRQVHRPSILSRTCVCYPEHVKRVHCSHPVTKEPSDQGDTA